MDQNTERKLLAKAVPKRTLTWRRTLTYTAICVFFVLALGELAIRGRAWYRYGSAADSVPDKLTIVDEKSGLRVPRPGVEQVGSKIHIKINSLGFRGDEFAQDKPPRTIRIACVGASTTFCAEVTDNSYTWPAQLQKILQTKYPQVGFEVINAGVGGFVIDQSIKNLEFRVLPLKPDLVIFYEANNDMAIDTRVIAQLRGIIGENSQYRSPFSKFMSRNSLLYDLIHKNLIVVLNRQDRSTGKLTNLPANLPERFINRLGQMHRLLAEHNIPLVLSCYVTKYRRDQPRETQIANAELAFFYMPWMTIDSLLDGMDLYNEAIVRFAQSHQIPVAVDRVSIPATDHYFADFVHFRDAGCTAMAERIAKCLEESDVLGPLIARQETGKRR